MKNLVSLTLSLAAFALSATAQEPSVDITISGAGKAISPDLFGIFFEDINYAADGGLYAELIQNRSFEYNAVEQPTWNELTCWEQTKRGGANGDWQLEITDPICAANPHYLLLMAYDAREGFGIMNNGYDGMPVAAGESYDVSVFARQLFMDRYISSDEALRGKPMPIVCRLEREDGTSLGEVDLEVTGTSWSRVAGTITAGGSDDKARFVLLLKANGGVAVDEVSVFPRKTFHDRPNGLRPDLAQAVADLHPKFVRFPGGCVAHGRGLWNIYHWKDTIGPVEQRHGQRNFWGYHQSVGLGYFEYFQFCEDIGAKPLPILAAGVCCPNSDQRRGFGGQCIAMPDMPAYIQDIMDLIEWANGPATSTWGAKRAAAGHPAPFHLEYLGIGNEEKIDSEFKERFTMIQEAIHARHPEITVIGTVGGHAADENFHLGWKYAREQRVPMVDEHYYESPQWFLDNRHRYDDYDRSESKVYVGEYAAQEQNHTNTFRTALAEAAYMTSLERNGDIVRLASYAPLLARQGHTQWRPDLIYFDNTRILLSANYQVQRLYATNQGDEYFPAEIGKTDADLSVSCVRDTQTGDLILKIVNASAKETRAKVELPSSIKVEPEATSTLLAGEPDALNTFEKPDAIAPVSTPIRVGQTFECAAPAYSFTLIRAHTR